MRKSYFAHTKTILLSIATVVILFIPVMSYAQSSSPDLNSTTIGIPVKAILVSGLAITNQRNLRYGTIVQRTGKVKVAMQDPNSGLFRIRGKQNSEVYCNLTPPKELTDGKGHSIPFDAKAAYNNKKNDPSTAIPFKKASGSVQGFNLKANPSHNQADAYIWVYGSIKVGDIQPGTYTGTFTISVTY